MLRRAFSTARVAFEATSSSTPAASSSKSSTPARLRRTKDPLASSARAQHYQIDAGTQFVVRPPPSVVPPTHPVPSSSAAASGEFAFVEPFVQVDRNQHMISPTPRRASKRSKLATSATDSTATTDSATTKRQLTAEEIESLQALRRSDPAHWTRTRLAEKFGISPTAVSVLGWGRGSDATAAASARRQQLEADQIKRQDKWGWKKQIAREERRRRREMW